MVRSPRLVMCAVGTPDQSLAGVPAARWLADELGARLQLVHVFDPMAVAVPPTAQLASLGRSTEDLVRAARVGAHGRLAEAARLLEGVEHDAQLLEGAVVPELLRVAREQGVSLLVTATAARGAIDWLLVGSVSAQLAASAPCPVLLVPHDAVLGAPGPLLCGYDGSDQSLRAARHAARLAMALRRGLVLAHVRSDRHGERAAIDRELDDAAAALGAMAASSTGGRLEVTVTVSDGAAGESLSRLANAHDAAAVVAGTRGRGPLTAALLGSVSADLVRLAGRPVILVPATADA